MQFKFFTVLLFLLGTFVPSVFNFQVFTTVPAPAASDSPWQLTFTVKTVAPATLDNFHAYFTQSMNNHWSYVALSILFFILLSFLIKLLRKRFCKFYPSASTTLVLQFSSLSTTVVVPIQTFPRLHYDLKFAYSKPLKNFTIHGYFPATLNFRWSAKITDTLNNSIFSIPNRISISYPTAWKLRIILQELFTVQLLFQSDNHFVHVPVASNNTRSLEQLSVIAPPNLLPV